ncbi:uncharacterized protein METZ01_LOCUS370470, partial [marine metagenome]
MHEAREREVDVVGLSGLITPSLEQMVHVASEMERLDLELPLLIGGATTSRRHTAVKIDDKYHGPTVHVTDASRCVPVLRALLDPDKKDDFLRAVDADHQKERETHAARKSKTRLIPLAAARKNRVDLDWAVHSPVLPREPGIHVFDDYPLVEIVDYIDWTPFFQAWEIEGRFPNLLADERTGEQARILHSDALALLDRIESEKLLRARAVVGLFPAGSVGDDIEVMVRDDERIRVHGLRQQFDKRNGRPNLCLADFVAPLDSDLRDHLGAFVVTAGLGLEELCSSFEADDDDYASIMAKALADR